jgi:formate dehydrogenase subunit delta
MSHSTHNKLVYMANQIGAFFATQGQNGKAVAAIADHIGKFWEPRMRAQIFAHLKEHGGEGLDPLPKEAIEMLARAADKKA